MVQQLYCPLDGDKLEVDENDLICDHGHSWDLEVDKSTNFVTLRQDM